MLLALRLLSGDDDEEIRSTVSTTLRTYDASKLRPIVDNPDVDASVLGFLATWRGLPRDLYAPVILHRNVPPDALQVIASTSELGEIIELVSLKQQALIQNPTIIDAILAN